MHHILRLTFDIDHAELIGFPHAHLFVEYGQYISIDSIASTVFIKLFILAYFFYD